MRLSLDLGLGSVATLNAGVGGWDIIILEGQSNMAGRDSRAAEDTDVALVAQFGGRSALPTYQTIDTDITPLQHPDATVNTNGYLGPGEYIAREYLAAHPGRRVLLVPCAVGGTKLVGAPATWASGNPGGSNYENAIAQANLAIAAAVALHPDSRVVGITSVQGEGDGDDAILTADYLTAKLALIAGLRARITGAADVPYIIGSMSPGVIRANAAGYRPIDTAHRQAVFKGTKTYFVQGPKGTIISSYHYAAADTRTLGTAMGAALNAAILGEAPTITYDFEQDVNNQTVALGVTDDSQAGAEFIIKNNVATGVTSYHITSPSAAIGSVLRFGFKLDAVPADQADMVVSWSMACSNTAIAAGMYLRSNVNGTIGTNGRNGYLFQVRNGDMRMFRVSANGSTITQLGSTLSIARDDTRRYRASAIGTSLLFEYSSDGGETWTTAVTATDATYASGGLSFLQAFGATTDAVRVDNIEITAAF